MSLFPCPSCGRSFDEPRSLLSHFAQKHKFETEPPELEALRKETVAKKQEARKTRDRLKRGNVSSFEEFEFVEPYGDEDEMQVTCKMCEPHSQYHMRNIMQHIDKEHSDVVSKEQTDKWALTLDAKACRREGPTKSYGVFAAQFKRCEKSKQAEPSSNEGAAAAAAAAAAATATA